MIANQKAVAKQEVHRVAEELTALVREAAVEGTAAHVVEERIFEKVLDIGRVAMGEFLDLQGDGDLGETITLPHGRKLRRLKEPHGRELHTIFGSFDLQRVVYGTREGQKIEFVPLDTRLQLPESKFSYVLQDWDQMLAADVPFAQVNTFLQRILGFRQHVDNLERMSQKMATNAEAFCWSQEAPPADEEGQIVVETADSKGVPIRRRADAPAIYDHQRSKPGPKPDRKKMAALGSVYTVDPFVRTPEEIVTALFRDPKEAAPAEEKRRRPRPCHKRVVARLNEVTPEGDEILGLASVFGWIDQQVHDRNPQGKKPLVCIMDGQESLWDAKDAFQSDLEDTVEILDLLHVTPRLWEAAHLFHAPRSSQAEQFVRERVLLILQGKVGSVVCGMRRMATLRGLGRSRRSKLQTICRYLKNNAHRMRYDDYLARGYPIASGVIEGACRHVVKDRLERTGMSWTVAGAQAMLHIRAIYVSDQWPEFMQAHIAQETQRLYPYRHLVEGVKWSLAL